MSDLTAAQVSIEQGLKGEVTAIDPGRFARTVARRSAESRATVPSVEYSTVADIGRRLDAVAQVAGLTPLLVRAAAAALVAHPRANGVYRDARYELYSRVNVGVTLAEGDTYVTPTVMDADSKSAAQIADELSEHLETARSAELHPSVLAGATFTVIAPSSADVTTRTPIIQPGQAAVLTAGPIRPTVLVREGELATGHTVELVLAADHRILYGAAATDFLQEIKVRLQEGD